MCLVVYNTKANAAKLRFADCYEAVTRRVMAILKTKKLKTKNQITMGYKKENPNKKANMEQYKSYIHYRKTVKGKLSYQEYLRNHLNK